MRIIYSLHGQPAPVCTTSMLSGAAAPTLCRFPPHLTITMGGNLKHPEELKTDDAQEPQIDGVDKDVQALLSDLLRRHPEYHGGVIVLDPRKTVMGKVSMFFLTESPIKEARRASRLEQAVVLSKLCNEMGFQLIATHLRDVNQTVMRLQQQLLEQEKAMRNAEQMSATPNEEENDG